MDYKNILYAEADGVAVITVNRPDKLNALNQAVMFELCDAAFRVQNSAAVRVAVLTGAENPARPAEKQAFIAGADIADLAKQTPVTGQTTARRGQDVTVLLEEIGKPVIAAINGFCFGGGCELAMACTFRVASENAKLGQPEINLGIIPGYGGTQRLPRLVGRGRALDLLLTGRQIDAQEAFRIGLVDRVAPVGKALEEAMKLAREIAAKPPFAVKYILDAVHRGLDGTLKEGLRAESDLFGMVSATEDMKEGLNAFLEKRKAVWSFDKKQGGAQG